MHLDVECLNKKLFAKANIEWRYLWDTATATHHRYYFTVNFVFCCVWSCNAVKLFNCPIKNLQRMKGMWWKTYLTNIIGTHTLQSQINNDLDYVIIKISYLSLVLVCIWFYMNQICEVTIAFSIIFGYKEW